MKTTLRLLTRAVLALALIAGQQAPAAPGDLDLTFNGTGKVVTPVGTGYDNAAGVMVQGDGKIVAVGSAQSGPYDFAVLRYLPNGTLDPGFGAGGKVFNDFGSFQNEYATGVALQNDGRIVAAGQVNGGAFAVARYLSTNGAFDTSFGGTGHVVTTIDGACGANGVVVQSDGKIVAAGFALNTITDFGTHGYDVALIRYNADGTLDQNFGAPFPGNPFGPGKSVSGLPNYHDVANGIALAGDGKFMISGTITATDFSASGMFLTRFGIEGYGADGTFGGGFVFPNFAGNSAGNCVAVNQITGDTYVAGWADGAGHDFAIARYHVNGTLDTNFGTGGKVLTSLTGGNDEIFGLALQSDGKIVATGTANGDFAVVRYNTDGTLDGTFGSGGQVITQVGTAAGTGRAAAVALQGDGRIVAAGYALGSSSTYDFAVVRYEGTVVPPETMLTSMPPVLDNHSSATFEFTSNAVGATFECALDGQPFTAATSPQTYPGLSDGAHSFSVRAIVSGVQDPTPAMWTWTVDTMPPDTMITSGPSGTVNSSEATFEFTASEPGSTFFGSLDGAPETEVTNPAIFTGLSQGPHTFTVYAIDAAGNPDPTPATQSWTVGLDPTHEALYSKGEPVPGAGSDPYIPSGATWYGFGIPAIDEDGTVAVLAKWRNPAGSATTYGSGLFVDGTLRLAIGAPVDGVAGATYLKLRDPVIAGGEVATIATLAGVPVTEDTAVVGIDSTGSVTVLAREGATATGTGGATFKAFKGVSIARGFGEVGHAGILYTALLNSGTGTPAVGTANDFGAWLSFDGATTLAVREGDSAPGLDVGETVKSFKLLKSASGSPGQGRGHTGQQTASFPVVTSTGRQRLLSFDLPTGGVLASSGDALGGTTLPLAKWKTFGPLSESTVALALRGVLQNNVGGVTGPAATGIFLGNSAGDAWEPVVQLGDATGLPDVTFKALKDPVLAADCESLAFPATLIGTGVTTTNDTSLWWKPDGGPLTLLAREGDPALGGGTWKSFASLAIPGGATGPIFLASLSSVPTTQDIGVWAVDSAGALRVLFREGDIVAGKTVKGIAVLKAVSGSPGTTHAFNSSAHVVWRAAFTDGTAAVVVTTVP